MSALVRTLAEARDGDQITLRGIGRELKRSSKATLEVVIDDPLNNTHVLRGHRRAVDLIPQHTPLLPQEMRVPVALRFINLYR